MTDVNEILNERKSQYGSFENVALYTEIVNKVLSNNKEQRTDVMNMAIYMIASKLARIASGNPSLKDNWVDIAGYAQLVIKNLEESGSDNVHESF
ncbi:hypothetical protein AAX06_06220 [Moraxella bovoculi]|uniref:DUF6378 domain-containing protein n=1 Tax=Moraxella bovoculi TaxID=386891 RepID=A0AAC8T877_9GAMM|nr:DUF6378 domain-containing protein [Moraxella bovoculi]AKG07817.1 hypothetical protein AAX06_06220 [Moraxella bovoculi]AKG11505.1 hypothetical protein AAX07_05305 [Moraxella bovoculi]AKG13470.1 hypothetical protein AAX11_04830 [Moraxella bovoculi]